MITAIEMENFKGIRDRARIELRPITLLFGPNSGGKSTILHAIGTWPSKSDSFWQNAAAFVSGFHHNTRID